MGLCVCVRYQLVNKAILVVGLCRENIVLEYKGLLLLSHALPIERVERGDMGPPDFSSSITITKTTFVHFLGKHCLTATCYNTRNATCAAITIKYTYLLREDIC